MPAGRRPAMAAARAAAAWAPAPARFWAPVSFTQALQAGTHL